MGDVRTIDGREFTANAEVNQSCIERCEALLQMARAGEIVGIAYVAQCGDGAFRRGAGGLYACYGVLGALDMTASDIRNTIHIAEGG